MGFYEYFNAERVQICGNMEFAYLASLDEKTRYERIDALFATKIPLFIVARGHELYPEMVEIAKKYGVPIARTQDSTTAFIAALIGYLNVELAPRITRHGVLIEVYGEGILIVGESGVGKSETAIELVKRCHRLVADDAVEFSRIAPNVIEGRAPMLLQNLLEVRGLGLLDIRAIFGETAVRRKMQLKLIVHLTRMRTGDEDIDRLPIHSPTQEVLGLPIRKTVIPVAAGRNIAVLLEAAVRNTIMQLRGFNTMEEFMERQRKAMMKDEPF